MISAINLEYPDSILSSFIFLTDAVFVLNSHINSYIFIIFCDPDETTCDEAFSYRKLTLILIHVIFQ